ncbi:piggyBac transposable element-derived protein 4 [Biomphalaria pfeifferi]|uniref:PiggyBac transposable element-derived protein 4 n=1 Tax=Biomphalaria pfeifferi TaxID=112525 RepID=A0AAD8BEW3_BIOPF|nr:piggyBac transposable element-derived protein 4 [Biomphalaria pfeifferi]
MLLPDRNDIGFKLFKVQELIKHFKVQELIKHFNAKFKYFYHPTQNVSIDESMIGFKGKNPHIRQFMPNKRHARFGIKMWCLSDSANGYLCQFEISEGSQGRRIGNGRSYTHELIIRLMTAAESMTSNFVPQKVTHRKRTRTEMEAARMSPTPLTQTVAGHPLDGHDLSKLPVGKKQQCVAGHPTRVRTGWECTGCKVGLCPECFAKYHRQL